MTMKMRMKNTIKPVIKPMDASQDLLHLFFGKIFVLTQSHQDHPLHIHHYWVVTRRALPPSKGKT